MNPVIFGIVFGTVLGCIVFYYQWRAQQSLTDLINKESDPLVRQAKFEKLARYYAKDTTAEERLALLNSIVTK